MTMTPDQYNELVSDLGGRVSSIRTNANAAAVDVAEENAEKLIPYAISNLPDKTYLNEIDYRDELSIKQVSEAIDKGSESLWESLMGWTDESEWESTKEYFRQALPGLDSDVIGHLMGCEEFEDFRLAVQERDCSDLIGDLMKNTGRVMFRVNLSSCSRIDNLDTEDFVSECGVDRDYYFESPMYLDADGFDTQVEMLLDSIAANPDESRTVKDKTYTNRGNAREIAANATYGGNPCLLVYLDVRDLYNAVQETHMAGSERQKDLSLTMTVKDPQYLIYDGLNGSGHEDTIYGTFKLTIPYKNISDVFYVDHKDAGTGYSWSEDIAGVVKSYFEQDPEYGYDPPLQEPEIKEVA